MNLSMPCYYGSHYGVIHVFTTIRPTTGEIECFTLVVDKRKPGTYEVQDHLRRTWMLFTADNGVYVPHCTNDPEAPLRMRLYGRIRVRQPHYGRRQELCFDQHPNTALVLPEIWNTYWGADVWTEIRLKTFQAYHHLSDHPQTLQAKSA